MAIFSWVEICKIKLLQNNILLFCVGGCGWVVVGGLLKDSTNFQNEHRDVTCVTNWPFLASINNNDDSEELSVVIGFRPFKRFQV